MNASEAVPDRPRRLFLGPGGALIFLVVLVAYWPVLRGEFVWDDALLVEKNPLVTGELGPFSVWFRTDFPLTLSAFWLQWLVWGKNAAGYHFVNIVLHSAGAVLLWRVLKRLEIPGAWLGALIFAVHPVAAGTVAWISELKNTLSLFFFLLAVFWYLRCDEEAEGVTSGEWRAAGKQATAAGSTLHAPRLAYALSLCCFVLSLLSKTSTVTLPVVLLLCAWWRRGSVTTRDALRVGPFFLVGLAFGLMTMWFQRQGMVTGSVQSEGLLGRLALAGRAVWFYLGKAFLPLNLSMIYPRWTFAAAALASYVPLILLCIAFAFCWRFRRGWGRAALFGLAYFTITLLPALGFIDMTFLTVSRVSDHLQYLALIGVAASIGAGLSTLLSSRTLGVVGVALVLSLTIFTHRRAEILAYGETLWRDTLARNPAAWTAHNNLGCILAEQQKLDEAITHFLASTELNPRNADAHRNAGRALAMRGRFPEAESHFEAALALKPNDAAVEQSFASALTDQGRNEEALQHLRASVRLRPQVSTRLQLAVVLRQTGNVRETIEQYRQVLRVEPENREALNNLAWLLATSADGSLRNGPEAVQAAELACRLTQYQETVSVGTLAAAYAEAGRFDEAVATAEKSLALATAAGQERFASLNQQLLVFYRAGKAWHEAPSSSGK